MKFLNTGPTQYLTAVFFVSMLLANASYSSPYELSEIASQFVQTGDIATDDRVSGIETLLDAQDKPDIAGGFAVVVVEGNKVLFSKAYGYANNEHDVPLTTSSVFDFASVAKQFTGLATAMLIEQGKIKLDDDIRKYLPELPDYGSVITIDHLLHHTSGLRDWVALVKISGRYMGDTITDDFLFRLISSQKELNFPPGEEFLYSNSGYFLLAQIVSRVTKTSFRNWCEENIFKPLEMNNTHFSDDHAEIIKGRADSYVQNEDGEYTNSSNLLTAFGSSSLYSTVDDMTKWVKNYDKKAVGGESAWEMMVKRGSLNDGQNVDYGFGLSIGDYKGIVKYQHGGSWAGYLCEIVYYPEKNLSHILIINRDPSGVYVSNELNAILFPEEKTEQKQTASKEGAGEDKVEISPEILEQYVGVFYSPKRKRIIEVERINDRLVLHFPWKRNVEAVPLSQEVFHIDEYGWEFSFASDDTGFVDQLRIHTGNGYSPYDRIYTDISSWEDSIDLTGEYYSKELQTTYTIVKRRSSLIAEHMQNEDVLLARVDKNHYVGDKWWFEGMKIIRKADDSVAGFRMSADNDAVRGVLFEKK